jgi:hypothetical protein
MLDFFKVPSYRPSGAGRDQPGMVCGEQLVTDWRVLRVVFS